MDIIVVLPIVFGVLLVITSVIYVVLLVRQRSAEKTELSKLKKLIPQNRKVNRWNIFFGRLYPVIIKIPLLQTLAKRIRTRLQMIHADDERRVRISTARFTIISATLFLGFLLSALFFSKNLFTTMGLIVTGFYVGGIVSDFFISRTEKKMMDGFLDLLRVIRNEYQRKRMVREALQEAGDKCNPLVAVHSRQFAKILGSIDPEESLRKYYHVAPNHFARQIAGICWIVSELGDSFVNGVSNFLEGLKKIQEEIRLDVLRSEELSTQLRGMEAICIVPLLLLGPMRMWSENYFPFMTDFYNGQLGVLALVLMFVLTLACLYIVRSMRSFDNNVKSVFEDNVLLQKLFRSKYFTILVNRITPRSTSKGYFRVKRRLANANAFYSMKEHFARKLIFGFFAFVVVMIIFAYSHYSIRYHMLHPKAIPDETGQISDVTVKRLEFEAFAIRSFNNKNLNQEENKLQLQYEVDQQAYRVPIDEMNQYMESLVGKIDKYKNQTIQWYEILISFVLALGLYSLPDLLLFFRKFMREMEMQNEVDRFYSIISILMNIQRITVIEILEWMHRNSIIFERQLLQCITVYGKGEWEALEALKQDANFIAMEQLIERLQECVENISVQRAFDDLEGERLFSLERRKLKYQQMVASRIEWSRAIGFIPMRVSVAVYLAFPIAYVAYQQFNGLMLDLPQ